MAARKVHAAATTATPSLTTRLAAPPFHQHQRLSELNTVVLYASLISLVSAWQESHSSAYPFLRFATPLRALGPEERKLESSTLYQSVIAIFFFTHNTPTVLHHLSNDTAHYLGDESNLLAASYLVIRAAHAPGCSSALGGGDQDGSKAQNDLGMDVCGKGKRSRQRQQQAGAWSHGCARIVRAVCTREAGQGDVAHDGEGLALVDTTTSRYISPMVRLAWYANGCLF